MCGYVRRNFLDPAFSKKATLHRKGSTRRTSGEPGQLTLTNWAGSRMNNRISPFSDLAGRLVIVTGAAAGIGLSISNAFAEQGCQLVLLHVNETSLTETAKGSRNPERT
jgi:hypothetical protein